VREVAVFWPRGAGSRLARLKAQKIAQALRERGDRGDISNALIVARRVRLARATRARSGEAYVLEKF